MVHLVDYEIGSDGPASSAMLTGAIGDYGSGEAVKPDGTSDPGHSGQPCDGTGAFIAQTIIISGTGTVSRLDR